MMILEQETHVSCEIARHNTIFMIMSLNLLNVTINFLRQRFLFCTQLAYQILNFFVNNTLVLLVACSSFPGWYCIKVNLSIFWK